MVKFAIDLLVIMIRLYLPWTGRKIIADKRVNEFFGMAKIKSLDMLFFDQGKMVTGGISLISESFRYNPTSLDIAAESHISLGTMFATAGWFRLTDRVLDVASKVVEEQIICDLTHQMLITAIYLYSGKWAEIPEYDKLLLKAGAEKGSFWDMGAYLTNLIIYKVNKGKFSQARELLGIMFFWKKNTGT